MSKQENALLDQRLVLLKRIVRYRRTINIISKGTGPTNRQNLRDEQIKFFMAEKELTQIDKQLYS